MKNNANYCNECLGLLNQNLHLKEEVKKLKALLKKQDRTIKEGYFGSSTPSSKKPPQPNSEQSNKNKGGQKEGHIGSGRSFHNEDDEEVIVQEVEVEFNNCPDCGEELSDAFNKNRSVIDIEPAKLRKILYLLKQKQCKKCKKIFNPKAKSVLPKFLYGNTFLSWLVVEHFVNGLSLGSIEKRTGIGIGSLISILHKLSSLFKNVPDILIEKYKSSAVKHADETSWDYDGKSSYAWLFTTDKLSIYQFPKTRSAKIVENIFGTERVPGVLVVDRYSAYNKANVDIQYCYAHLLRLVEDTVKEFPENEEVIKFCDHFSALLASAMSLRRVENCETSYLEKAQELEKKIKLAVNCEANHASIQSIQNIFRKNKDRLYHWVTNKSVPPDNNFAERELRPLVISRKLSYGSHSDEGAKTREILMTVIHSIKKNHDNPIEVFKNILDDYASQQDEKIISNYFL